MEAKGPVDIGCQYDNGEIEGTQNPEAAFALAVAAVFGPKDNVTTAFRSLLSTTSLSISTNFQNCVKEIYKASCYLSIEWLYAYPFTHILGELMLE